MKQLLLLAAASLLILTSCEKENEREGVFQGPKVSMHHGKAWTWVRLDKDGAPRQLGITLDQDLLNNVPVGDEDGGHNDGHSHANNLTLPLHPRAAAATPFRHAGLDWNPSGHEPEQIYTLPHFDFHFYMVTEAERLAMTSMDKLNDDPPAGYLPANHIGGAPVPQMGKHWIDLTSPELSGATFTQTFIYGSYDKKVTFYEPMITKLFLEQTQSFERPIPQPAKYQKAGYYPTKLRIFKHDGLTEVVLDDFVYRTAS